MAAYILDTSVISGFAPGHTATEGMVQKWFVDHQDDLHLTVITILELERGIAKLRRLGASAKARDLDGWLQITLAHFEPRILDLDRKASGIAGRLIEEAAGRGYNPGLPDVLIGSIARQHGMQVLTRNLKDFRALEIDCLDPFTHSRLA